MTATTHSDPAPKVADPRARRLQIAAGLGIALAIVVAAWFAVGKSNWDSIGSGGVNTSLLPKVGDQAPDFLTEDVLGQPVRLSDFRGQPVWLMFWGSWCGPCRAEMPEIIEANAQLKKEGVVLLGVSVRESALEALDYAAKSDANFLVLSDPDETDTGDGYPLFNVPTHIFIDADGIVRSIVLANMDVETALRESRALQSPPSDQEAATTTRTT